MSANELAMYLFPVIDSTSHFPIIDLCTKWALLQKTRHGKYIAAMMTGPTLIIRDWPLQRRLPSDGVPFDLFTLSDDWLRGGGAESGWIRVARGSQHSDRL